ncbi:MAG: Nif11-like leader peptide family RiPP precursor [Pseudomonadota bacterium]
MKTVRHFLTEAVSNNPDIQTSIYNASTLGEIVEIAASTGYQITMKEALEAFMSPRLNNSNSLTMDELVTVAGGVDVKWNWPLQKDMVTLKMGCYQVIPPMRDPALYP